jgi:hypothetical protein
MLKVKLYFFSSFFLVEVVRFFVTYGLARNKTIQYYKIKKENNETKKYQNRLQKKPENNFF